MGTCSAYRKPPEADTGHPSSEQPVWRFHLSHSAKGEGEFPGNRQNQRCGGSPVLCTRQDYTRGVGADSHGTGCRSFAEFQGERIILTVPSDLIRQVTDPEELMRTWDEIYDSYDELVGLDPDRAMPHTAHQLNRRYVADGQISSGAMHAGYPIMMPFSYAANLLDVDYITTNAWGFWHELGHEYQQRTWTWGDVGEVTVNLFSLYTQEKYGNTSELLKVGNDGKDYYDRGSHS